MSSPKDRCTYESSEKVYNISSLKPKGIMPNYDLKENYLETFGIKRWFWYNIVIPALKKRFDNKCCLCKSKRELVVHHKSYEEQTIDNLYLVCRKCHKKIHKGVAK